MIPMKLNEYQEAARSTAIYPEEDGLIYTVLGLNGEVGEIAEKVKKMLRDDKSLKDCQIELIHELGDVLWYVANLAHELGVNLETVAIGNISKLASRNKRDVLKGDGDNR